MLAMATDSTSANAGQIYLATITGCQNCQQTNLVQSSSTSCMDRFIFTKKSAIRKRSNSNEDHTRHSSGIFASPLSLQNQTSDLKKGYSKACGIGRGKLCKERRP